MPEKAGADRDEGTWPHSQKESPSRRDTQLYRLRDDWDYRPADRRIVIVQWRWQWESQCRRGSYGRSHQRCQENAEPANYFVFRAGALSGDRRLRKGIG